MSAGRASKRSKRRRECARIMGLISARQREIFRMLIDEIPDVCYRAPCLRRVF